MRVMRLLFCAPGFSSRSNDRKGGITQQDGGVALNRLFHYRAPRAPVKIRAKKDKERVWQQVRNARDNLRLFGLAFLLLTLG